MVIERNYYSPVGEIDIVAKHGEDYYFIEVKTRRLGELATDLAVTRQKIRKLQKTIKRYCFERSIGEVGILLASLLVTPDARQKTAQLRFVVIH